MADLGTNVRYIKGIGEARAAALEKLGITTLGDLIAYFPRGYEDRTQVRPIRELTAGESVCVRGMVAADLTAYRISGGRTIAKTRVVDDSGAMDLVFFNAQHLGSSLRMGETYVFFGRVEDDLRRKQMINPLFEPEGRQQVTGRIMPIYPLTAGVTQGLMARVARQGLDACRELLPDVLPDEVRQAHKLCYVNYAYENIHFPASPEALEVARRRLVFEELFLLTCGLQLLRQRRRDVAGPACRRMSMEPFYRRLPFALTGAQRRAIADAVEDMVSGKPMNRLCQGDVGSGKTMVAAACIWFAVENGWQTALMAPTEILARQHYQGLAPLLARFSIRCALLTGSTRAKERREILAGLADGSIDLCIGTHALLTEDVQYRRLGLVVTDEQHRFGVNQRAALSQKAEDPHMLVLSATPIPRTLALVIYGDLDVSVIDELPPGRQKVDTFALGESYRPRVQAFIRKLAAAGQQILRGVPPGGGAGPDPRRAQGRDGLRQAAAGAGVSGPAGGGAPREDETQGEGEGHGGLCRRGKRYPGVHHRGGGGRGRAQRHVYGGGECRPVRPVPAAPAAGPGGPGQGQKLLHPAVGQPERGDPGPAEGDDPDQRRLPHLPGGPAAAGAGRFLRPAAARPAGHEDRRPQLRHAASGRGPDGGPAADGPGSGADGADPSGSAGPHPPAVRHQRGYAELRNILWGKCSRPMWWSW